MKCDKTLPGNLVRYGTLNIFYLVVHLFEDRMHVIRIKVGDKAIGYQNFSTENQFNIILK